MILDNLPNPIQQVNLDTKEPFYEYENSPISEDEIGIL